jgi:hypothetical protein
MPKLSRVVTVDNVSDFVIKTGQNGCWTWNPVFGHRNPGGYHMYRHQLVHRQVYVLFKGPIPGGLDLHHTCRNRKCVNPDHLIPVTDKDHPDGGHIIWKNKTHCPRGHEYSPENTRVYKGSRFCIQCDKNRPRIDPIKRKYNLL